MSFSWERFSFQYRVTARNIATSALDICIASAKKSKKVSSIVQLAFNEVKTYKRHFHQVEFNYGKSIKSPDKC